MFVYERILNDKKVVVISSFSDKPIKFKYLKTLSNSKLIISNYDQNEEITLKPFECRLYEISGYWLIQ